MTYLDTELYSPPVIAADKPALRAAHSYHNQVELTRDFALEGGGRLPLLKMAYCDFGPDDAPVIWVCHALTANADVESWWPGLVGPGLPIDTNKFRVICPNILGSCYGSTGPDDWGRLPEDFPLVTVRDQARAQLRLAWHLGIVNVHTLIGGSLGGMQAMELAVLAPRFPERLVLLATSARHSPWAIAFNEAQRMALGAEPSDEGLAAARAIAMLSYRTYGQYQSTQAEANPKKLEAFAASGYQRYQGLKLAGRFSPFAYRALTLAMDSHNVGRGRGGIEQALAEITAQTKVIAISSDGLFPPEEQRLLAKLIPNSTFFQIESPYGHDGFLTETAAIGEALKS